jgi:ABC-type multidrug transport system fused ATPase/permease subunit
MGTGPIVGGTLTEAQLRRRLLELAKPILPPLGLSILFRVVGLAAGIALLGLAGWAVLGAAAGPVPPGPEISALVILSLVKGLARYLEQYCGHYVAFQALAKLRLYFYDRLAPQAPAGVEGRDTGDLLARVTKDVDRVEVFFAHTIAPALTAVIVPAATLVYTALAVSPWAVGPLAAGFVWVGLVTPALGRASSAKAAGDLRAARGALASHTRDSVQGVREVLAFNSEERRLAELDALGRPLGRSMRALGGAIALRRGLNLAAIALVLLAQLIILTAVGLPPALMGLGLGVTAAAFGPVTAVEEFAADLQQAYASARRVFEVTDAPPLVADTDRPDPARWRKASQAQRRANPSPDAVQPTSGTGVPAVHGTPTSTAKVVPEPPADREPKAAASSTDPVLGPRATGAKALAADGRSGPGRKVGTAPSAAMAGLGPAAGTGPGGSAPPTGPGRLRPAAELETEVTASATWAPEVAFEGVTFRHPGAARSAPALSDVTLRARAGQVTAVVGASGSGKSTLAALLTRTWDPASGRITLDGRPLGDWPLAELRSLVAVSPQRPYLFNQTIRENLLLARPEASAAELERVAQAARLDQVIATKAAGWDAPVGELGELLSGGERQRLALARTLLRAPAVLVADEATSQLDAATEASVLEGLRAAGAGRTVVVIAHRLASIRDADTIWVLDAGRVVQHGAWEELAAQAGPFADLLEREDR